MNFQIAMFRKNEFKVFKMLHTIGYEKAELDDFISTLVLAKINTLVDVRDRAQSRKRGFSKTALSEALNNAGINYQHMKQLGDPKEGREAARAGQWEKFDKIYSAVLRSEVAQLAVKEIAKLSKNSNACLLCYERDFKTCHRKYISDQVDQLNSTKTKHLGVVKRRIAA